MSRLRFGRLPPAGEPIRAGALWRLRGASQAASGLCAGLNDRLGTSRITLHASGREALRALLVYLASRSGRREVVIPAYTCFSVAASVVAAGLRVRLVDVDEHGRIDATRLAALPLDRAVAVVVCNLFGLPEPVQPVRDLADAAGAVVVDDAAQSLGARSSEGAVGGRAAVGLLSFGRGKPLGALGGGALAWSRGFEDFRAPPAPRPKIARALVRAGAWDAARRPGIFRLLAAVPGLKVGVTEYDPAFGRGGIDPASLGLAAALLDGLEAEVEARSDRARRIAETLAGDGSLRPLLARGNDRGSYPRLAVLASDEDRRDLALRSYAELGAGRFYPTALDSVAGLRERLVGDGPHLGARELAARLLTLATHSGAERAIRRLG